MNFIKPLLLSLMFSHTVLAQQPNFENLWSEVEQLELADLPKSALEKVEHIDKIALKHNNQPQHIKSMLYKSKFALVLEEDAQISIINNFKSEIAKSKAPTKNILESILANLYWDYFRQNRYQFYNRTKTAEKVDKTDFRTWDLSTLFAEIQNHFQHSLNQETILKETSTDEFSDLLVTQKESKIYRPTLFDFLSHNALQFYKSNERNITKPAYKFEVSDPKLLSPAIIFTDIDIETKDQTSLEFQALTLYQDLICYHLQTENTAALVAVDIERLLFVKQHATFKNAEQLLIDALQDGSTRYKNSLASASYDLERARMYKIQGDEYSNRTSTEQLWKLKDAVALCNRINTAFPETRIAKQALNLKSEILQPEVKITTESTLPIQTKSRLLITYKNTDGLKFKVAKLSHKSKLDFKHLYRQKEKDNFAATLKYSKTWSAQLKTEGDFQTHTTEIIAPAFDNGIYFIAATDPKSGTTGYTTFQVSNMALVKKDSDKHLVFQIIDRNTGQPITNTEVITTYRYNNNKTKTERNLTDSYGNIRIPKTTKRQYVRIDLAINSTNDTAYFDSFQLSYYYKRNTNTPEPTYKSFSFTDRSLYRPGQTVYFKAIAMQTTADNNAVLTQQDLKVSLYNVNREIVKTLTLKTNDFGSVHGNFILPTTGLNGRYYIEVSSANSEKKLNSRTYFNVEDYKRPTFKATFNPITETYKINDSVTISGNALAFSASSISGAKVVYRVTRKVEFPNWYSRTRPYYYNEAQEITHGELTTYNNGDFSFTFKALADVTIDKSALPIFNYEVTADITDINGETRSASTLISVGYHTTKARLEIENKLNKTEKDHTIGIQTMNLNGEFVPVKGSLKIYKLQGPRNVLRTRPWEAPDYQIIDKNTFKATFPHDAYSNEDDLNNWTKGKLVFEKNVNTADIKTLNLGKIKSWDSGQYIAVFESITAQSEHITTSTTFALFNPNDTTVADHGIFEIQTDKSEYQPEDLVALTLASAAEHLVVTVEIEKNYEVFARHTIILNQNKKTITIPVSQSDLGGFAIHYSYAAFNSFKSGTEHITVPYPETDLRINTKTFRDKIQPGTQETWEFNISGPQGEKLSSEVLASMYDASLDEFYRHSWNLYAISQPRYSSYNNWRANSSFGNHSIHFNYTSEHIQVTPQLYDALNWFGFNFNGNQWINRRYLSQKRASMAVPTPPSSEVISIAEDSAEVAETVIEEVEEDVSVPIRGVSSLSGKNTPLFIIDGVASEANTVDKADILSIEVLKPQEAMALYGRKALYGVVLISTKNGSAFNDVKIRKNLKETAFFFPQLQTNSEGDVSFSFTSPEALTQWKLQLLAHSKSMNSAIQTLTTVTQKELMVQPNTPRFLRQGDAITISSKISNLSDTVLNGEAVLQLFDATTNAPIDINLENTNAVKSFSVDTKNTTQVSWKLKIPETVDAVLYKIIAKAGTFSDGEQNILPVLSNRTLVTESMPLWVNGNEIRHFQLDKLKHNTSKTLKHHKLTLEITSNPAWYAIQALPYIIEYPFDCNEQIFSRFYGNSLASHIVTSNPRIQEVFNLWKSKDALISNLEKNEDLKSILIEETPWLRDAQSETEQKKRIGLLFDMNTMSAKLQATKQKLERNQLGSGAWPWFAGGSENRYITQHIVTGFGHLQHLGLDTKDSEHMLSRAIKFTDSEFIETYKNISKYNAKPDYDAYHLNDIQLHYLYMRSFYTEDKPSKELQNTINYYGSQIKKYWTKGSLYNKGLMALIAQRLGDKKTATAIIKSLKENSITNDELGMYWKANTASWYWYESPIETQSLLIEAFSEIENDTTTVDNLTKWLLKNKQTNRWSTTKSTTDAIYAILLKGSDWLSVTESVDITVGGQPIPENKLKDIKVEAGTGYFKTTWNADEITPELAEITLTNKNKGIAWGSLYWQYFENLDAITSAETPLQLTKKLFIKSNTDTGEALKAIKPSTKLKVGDLITVRITLKTDRNMEFLHMKDMRASGLEPVNVLSSYKWQDGLGYYESTKDAATHFFFDAVSKGVYVFEYDLRVNNAGKMSNGITTIESMYAPEFSSHSEGTTITIK
ncbi:MG2 domain-containing protein [uncultured Formosa sp.]|uniref:alpha-2-macroglobulin family protein n=1 Tax=uncultured Formosa sp. TaxID=255435 RepID=UPI002626A1C7|nr:MG2 domain-containing protein [uncultured Formosa sp.]